MKRMLKRGILGALGLVLVAGAIIGAYSVRVAREVARVERTIVVPLPTATTLPATILPTTAILATAPPTAQPTAVAAVSTSTSVRPTATAALPTPTIIPATPTVVAPPSAGKVLSDGIRTGIGGSDGHEPVWQGKQYIHILLLGLDRRDETEIARSDTMIIVTVDLWDGIASMLSIPRDLVVPIAGHGQDRVNAAYAYGEAAHPDDPAAGPALAVATVAKAFDIPIEHYIQIDFKGFRGVVDAVGGVDIDIATTIDDPDYPTDDYGYKHIHFNPGCYHLDGEQALEYARARHDSDDNVRRDRQMQVMQAVLDRTGGMNAARQLPDIIRALGDTVQTSIPWEGQLSLARMSPRINAAGVARYSIEPPMVRDIITYAGAWVYIGDWPAIHALAREATDPKVTLRQDQPSVSTPAQGTNTNDLTRGTPSPRCGSG
jgi:LCP family protein required for cell wall assembly